MLPLWCYRNTNFSISCSIVFSFPHLLRVLRNRNSHSARSWRMKWLKFALPFLVAIPNQTFKWMRVDRSGWDGSRDMECDRKKVRVSARDAIVSFVKNKISLFHSLMQKFSLDFFFGNSFSFVVVFWCGKAIVLMFHGRQWQSTQSRTLHWRMLLLLLWI